MSYAAKTSVSCEKSQTEIRKTLTKYKATGFAIGESNGVGVIMFEMNKKRIRLDLPLAVHGKTKNNKGWSLTLAQTEQENRRLWRCLLLAVKSKLESVASKITTFEEEFLAHIVLPNGQTMGSVAIPQLNQSYETNKMPPLLGYSS